MTASRGSVLVTGGAGYIGSHVCKALSQAGYLPVSYDDLSRGNTWAVRWGPLVAAGLHDTTALRSALATHMAVGVIHLAGLAYVGESVDEPDLYRHVNVEGSRCLLDVLRGAGDPPAIVFSSTCSIYGGVGTPPFSETDPPNPMNPYAETKLAVEQMIDGYAGHIGGRATSLRYFNAAGADPDGEIGEAHDPETHLIPLALSAASGNGSAVTVYGDDFPTSDGTCIRDYVHVSDLADAHVGALERLIAGAPVPPVMNLATSHGHSVFEVLRTVERVTGRAVPHTVGPRRPGDPPMLTGTAEAARSVLEWTPRFNLTDQVRHAWSWHQANTTTGA